MILDDSEMGRSVILDDSETGRSVILDDSIKITRWGGGASTPPDRCSQDVPAFPESRALHMPTLPIKRECQGRR